MTKSEKKIYAQYMRDAVAAADKMWDDKASHAMIIGYLQGTLKGIATMLESGKPEALETKESVE